MKKFITSIAVFICVIVSFCQGQNQCGEILPYDGVNKMPVQARINECIYLNLPKSIDLSSKMPPVANQNGKKTCWAFATTYYLISYLNNKDKKDNFFYLPNGMIDYTKIYSPELPVFLQFRNGNCNQGAFSFSLLNKTLNEFGFISLAKLPFQNNCLTTLSPDIITEAQKNIPDSILYGIIPLEHTNLDEIKFVLAIKNTPLLLSLPVDARFISENNHPRCPKNGEYWCSELGYSPDNHAMVIVGYNDTLEAVKVINSWGTNWANKGYIWIKYEVLKKRANYYAYIHSLKTDKHWKKHEDVFALQIDSSRKEDIYSDWVQPGYYRLYNNFRIGLADLHTNDNGVNEIIINIRENLNLKKQNNLLFSFALEENNQVSFYVGEQQYLFNFLHTQINSNNKVKEIVFSIQKIKPF